MLRAGGVCCFRRRGQWWTRLSIDTEHMGRPVEALEVLPACDKRQWFCHLRIQCCGWQSVSGAAISSTAVQIAEAALADEHVTHGDRLALQRRVLRLGKPPRRWRRPPWATAALSEPQEVCLIAKPLSSKIGAPPCASCFCHGSCMGFKSIASFRPSHWR